MHMPLIFMYLNNFQENPHLNTKEFIKAITRQVGTIRNGGNKRRYMVRMLMKIDEGRRE